jgi:hypothetical protein
MGDARRLPLTLASPLRVPVAYLGAAAASHLWLGGFLEQPTRLLDGWLLGGLAVALGVAHAESRAIEPRRLWTALWALLAALSLANLGLGWLEPRHYGDWREITHYIATGRVLARWLAGSALLVQIHAALASTAGLAALEPRELATQLVRWSGAGVSLAAALAIVRRWPARLAVLLPCTAPIWILFSLGHLEYYPFVAWSLVAALAWATDRPLAQRSPWTVGAIAAALPLAYLGFAPIGALLCLAYVVAAPRRTPALAMAAGLVFFAGLLVFWGSDLGAYAHQVWGSGADWESTITFPAYRGKSAPGSFLFTWSAAFEPGHLLDLLFTHALGAGPLALAFLLAGVPLLARDALSRPRRTVDAGVLFLIAAFLWQAHYSLRMLPQRGPIDDFDTLFSSYLVLAFAAGFVLDQRLARRGPVRFGAPAAWLLAAHLAGAAVACAPLIEHGPTLPRPRWGAAEYLARLALEPARQPDPELAREMLRAVGRGTVASLVIPGSAGARGLGLTFDRWSRGIEPGALWIPNPTTESARPILMLTAAGGAPESPLRVTLTPMIGPPGVAIFEHRGRQRIPLAPIPPGGELLLLFQADRATAGSEVPPRSLGARIDAVELD